MRKHETTTKESQADHEGKLQIISSLQVERDMLKEHICGIDGQMSLKDKDLGRLEDQL